MTIQKRLKALIKEERYSQKTFAEMIGIPLRSLENYISGRQDPGSAVMVKITNHPEFKKYTLWLMTGDSEQGFIQTSPSKATQKKCGIN
ncbi:helix-turn-helix domain-containing protein [Aliivibrio fischeri]|nr:helix-turn-helix transcriptional regulator [Aliivibrio fischeri]